MEYHFYACYTPTKALGYIDFLIAHANENNGQYLVLMPWELCRILKDKNIGVLYGRQFWGIMRTQHRIPDLTGGCMALHIDLSNITTTENPVSELTQVNNWFKMTRDIKLGIQPKPKPLPKPTDDDISKDFYREMREHYEPDRKFILETCLRTNGVYLFDALMAKQEQWLTDNRQKCVRYARSYHYIHVSRTANEFDYMQVKGFVHELREWLKKDYSNFFDQFVQTYWNKTIKMYDYKIKAYCREHDVPYEFMTEHLINQHILINYVNENITRPGCSIGPDIDDVQNTMIGCIMPYSTYLTHLRQQHKRIDVVYPNNKKKR